jgi:hypothetical protein
MMERTQGAGTRSTPGGGFGLTLFPGFDPRIGL